MSPLAEYHRSTPTTSGVSYRAVAAGKGRLSAEGKGRSAGLKGGKKHEETAVDSATRGKHAVLSEEELATFRTCFCTRYQQNKCPNSDSCEKSHCLTWQRRNPYEISYCPQLCPEIQFVKKSRKMVLYRRCTRGKTCNFAHSKEEGLYHPLVYKTKRCSAWPKCSRYFCPFVHSPNEMRDVSHLKHLEPSNFTGQTAAYTGSGGEKGQAVVASPSSPGQQTVKATGDTLEEYQVSGKNVECGEPVLVVCGSEKTSIIDYDLLDDFDVLNYTTSRLAAENEIDRQQECLRVGCQDDQGIGFVDFSSKFSSGLGGTGVAFGFESHAVDSLNADASTCTATATASSTATAAVPVTTTTSTSNASSSGLWYDAPTLAAICAYDDGLDNHNQQQQYFVGGGSAVRLVNLVNVGSGHLYPPGAVASGTLVGTGGYAHGQDGLVLVTGRGIDVGAQAQTQTSAVGGDVSRRLQTDETEKVSNDMVFKSLYTYDYDVAASSSSYPNATHGDYGMEMGCNAVVGSDGSAGHSVGSLAAMHPQQQLQMLQQHHHPVYFYPGQPTITTTASSHPQGTVPTMTTTTGAMATTETGVPCVHMAQCQTLSPIVSLTSQTIADGQLHAFFERMDNAHDLDIAAAGTGTDSFTPAVFGEVGDDDNDINRAATFGANYGQNQPDGRLYQLYTTPLPVENVETCVAAKGVEDYRDLEQHFCNLDLAAAAGVEIVNGQATSSMQQRQLQMLQLSIQQQQQQQIAGDAALVSLPVNIEDYHLNDMLLKFINEIEK